MFSFINPCLSSVRIHFISVSQLDSHLLKEGGQAGVGLHPHHRKPLKVLKLLVENECSFIFCNLTSAII